MVKMAIPVIKTPPNENADDLKFLYRQFKSFQALRLALENTMRNFERDWKQRTQFKNISKELEKLHKLITPAKIVMEDPLGNIVKEDNIWSEKYWMKMAKLELSRNKTWNEFLSKIQGVGPITAAGLLGYIGDPMRFYKGKERGLRSLWHYCGLHVVNGKAPKRKKGSQHDWNPKLRALLLGVLADNFIKKRTPKYREIYDQEKERQLQNGLTKAHAHRRAIRKMMKEFLKDLWNYWFAVSP